MPTRRECMVLLGAVLTALAAISCSQAAGSPEGNRTLTVAAASDVQFAFRELGGLFERETGNKVIFLFGSSGNLEKQIENGAPIDLFASADEQYVRLLASTGHAVPGTERLYGLGRVVLVSSKSGAFRGRTLEELLSPEVRNLALANPDHAPYGLAAKQALVAAGLWEKLKPKVVYGEDVRQTLQFVQTGNAEAGIVALSIAGVPEVASSPIQDSLYQPLRQTMVVVDGARQEGLAREFADFINGPKGRPIMKRYGFTLPEEN